MNACVARTPSLDLTPDRLEEPLHGVSANSIKQSETLIGLEMVKKTDRKGLSRDS